VILAARGEEKLKTYGPKVASENLAELRGEGR
jgi:hypothetical protein